MAELSAEAGAPRPHPPGTYPVVVIGSGPGGLQVSASLSALGVGHAVLSADPGPGGMFRRWPHFQRLLSWTKPHAPAARGTRAYERYDWNSLLGEAPGTKALQPEFMDGTSYFPSRPEMQANLEAFASRAGVVVRYGCRWQATRMEEGPTAPVFVVETSDGEYRTTALVIAVGVAEPHTPPGDGMELTHHYADVRPVESYRDRRVAIIGKQNSGFELASGLLPWARQLVLASPSHARLSVETRSLVGVRARYVQPFEDHVLGGGVAILDAAVDRIVRLDPGSPDGPMQIRFRRTDGSTTPLELEVDDVISATGFVTPLLDLPALGVATFGASRLPAQSPWWESATMPGISFAGTIGQGARGLQRHGIPANSGAVHGSRYNARLLAARLAERVAGFVRPRPPVDPATLTARIAHELEDAAELWHQRGYLARVYSLDPAAGLVDDGVQPLADVLDRDAAPRLAVTLEGDGSGAIYPALFVCRANRVTERLLEPDPLLRYGQPERHAAIESVVAEFLGGR